MTEELNKTADAESTEAQPEKSIAADIKIEIQAETPEEDQEERPGVCCGSCS